MRINRIPGIGGVLTHSIGVRAVWLLALLTVPACNTGTEPGNNPVPAITSLSPSALTNASPVTGLTVRGSGFVRSSRVRIDGADRETFWHSDAEISAVLSGEDFASSRSLGVTVYTPPPGGGTSIVRSVPVTVMPIVKQFQPTLLTAGQGGTTVAVIGSGFQPGAFVRWDGVDRPTVRLSGTNLTFTLGWADLAAAGRHLVTVHHAGHPADSSEEREFFVLNQVPVVHSLVPGHATAGQGAFTLTVNGSRFLPGTIVEWNGLPRPTTYVSRERVTAMIEAGDVVGEGSVTIRLRNPDPAHGPSEAVLLPVRRPGRHVLPFVAGDLVWDPVRHRIYASIRSTDLTYPNHVIAIEPVSGEVLQAVYVGSDPLGLALSDDASVLYVGLDGAGAIRLVNPATFAAGLQFPMALLDRRIRYADDVEVMPGRPGTVAVVHQLHGYSEGPGAGLAIYDHGVPRPVEVSGLDGGTVIEFAGPDTLYAFNGGSTGHAINRILVADSGVVVEAGESGLMWGFYTDFAYYNGLLFGTDGSIVDPIRFETVGTVTAGGTVVPDPVTNRMFYMYESTLSSWSASTFAQLGSETVSGLPPLDQPGGFRLRLVRWGLDGFAYRTFEEIVIFRSDLAAP